MKRMLLGHQAAAGASAAGAASGRAAPVLARSRSGCPPRSLSGLKSARAAHTVDEDMAACCLQTHEEGASRASSFSRALPQLGWIRIQDRQGLTVYSASGTRQKVMINAEHSQEHPMPRRLDLCRCCLLEVEFENRRFSVDSSSSHISSSLHAAVLFDGTVPNRCHL